jgi:hypothetical protein
VEIDLIFGKGSARVFQSYIYSIARVQIFLFFS